MEDNRWPKRIMAWSPEGRRRGRPEMKWERELERLMKQIGRLVVVTGRDFVSALQPGGFLYYPRIKANVTE
jgi:hypothetical protein